MELQVAFKVNHMSIARVFKIFDTDGFVETVDIIESDKFKCPQRKCQKLAYYLKIFNGCRRKQFTQVYPATWILMAYDIPIVDRHCCYYIRRVCIL